MPNPNRTPDEADRPAEPNVSLWYEYPKGIRVMMGNTLYEFEDGDEAREFAADVEESFKDEGVQGAEELAFISDLRELADEYDELEG